MAASGGASLVEPLNAIETLPSKGNIDAESDENGKRALTLAGFVLRRALSGPMPRRAGF
jgi:hypothetical protein